MQSWLEMPNREHEEHTLRASSSVYVFCNEEKTSSEEAMDFRSPGPGLSVMHSNCMCTYRCTARTNTQVNMQGHRWRTSGNWLQKTPTHLMQVFLAHAYSCSGPLCLLLGSVKLRGHDSHLAIHQMLCLTDSTVNLLTSKSTIFMCYCTRTQPSLHM